MRRLFLDSTVPLFAAGQDHPSRAPAVAIMAAAGAGELQLHGSAEVVEEFLFHRLRRDDRARGVELARRLARSLVIHPFDGAVVEVMLDLVGSTHLCGRDAVHAATALVHGFNHIVTADAAFEGLAGLRRIDLPDALP